MAGWRVRKVSAKMLENMAEVPRDVAKKRPLEPAVRRRNRRKLRLRTVAQIDARTVSGKRARVLAAVFEATLGGELTDAQRLSIGNAAALTAIAEDAQVRRLQGDTTVSLDDLVRCVSCARRAVRDLGLHRKRERDTLSSAFGGLTLPSRERYP
jgi:hypothetical protein